MVEKENYAKLTSKSNLTQEAVYNTWTEIWNKDVDRPFTVNFEVYGDKAQDPTNAEVEFFITVK